MIVTLAIAEAAFDAAAGHPASEGLGVVFAALGGLGGVEGSSVTYPCPTPTRVPETNAISSARTQIAKASLMPVLETRPFGQDRCGNERILPHFHLPGKGAGPVAPLAGCVAGAGKTLGSRT